MKTTPKIFYSLKKLLMTPHLDTDPKPEMLSAVLTGNRIPRDAKKCMWLYACALWICI